MIYIHIASYVKHSVLPQVCGRYSVNISYHYLSIGTNNHKKDNEKKPSNMKPYSMRDKFGYIRTIFSEPELGTHFSL